MTSTSRQSEIARNTSRWGRAKLESKYPGDDSAAEIIELRIASWIDDEHYPDVRVKAAIIKAIDRAKSAGCVESYAHKILASEPPGPIQPANGQPKPAKTYHVAPPRPKFPLKGGA